MLQRMIGAATFNAHTYEEVEHDTTATKQAMLVVVLVSIATGIGAAGASGTIWGFVVGIVLALAGWAVWAWITYFIGTTIFATSQTQADWGQLARGLGFAQAAGVLKVLGVLSPIAGIVILLVSLWQFACMITAVRQALDYTSTLRAIGVVLVGFIPYIVLMVVIAILFPGAVE
ncbi:MAG: YIP1 family protein [Chloroflexi bacterium]|nr:YIP1 family protein [Chloroflexota bacterium]